MKPQNAFTPKPSSTVAKDMQRSRNSVPKTIDRASYVSVTGQANGRVETTNRQRMAKAAI